MQRNYRCPHCGSIVTIDNPETSHIIVGKHGITNLGQNDVTSQTNLANQAQKELDIRKWLEREQRKVLRPCEGYSNLRAIEKGIDHEEQTKESQRKSGFV